MTPRVVFFAKTLRHAVRGLGTEDVCNHKPSRRLRRLFYLGFCLGWEPRAPLRGPHPEIEARFFLSGFGLFFGSRD